MTRTAVIVDAYSTGRFLAPEMARYGVDCVHVQSGDKVNPHFSAALRRDDFIAHHVFSGVDTTAEALRVYEPFSVITGSEAGVAVADLLADALGTPANDLVRSAARRNKNAMADALRANGVRAIRGISAPDAQSAVDWMQREGLTEVVAKPLDSAGTEDVYFCRTPEALRAAASAILGKWNLVGSFNDAFLVQERIRGDQYTVNAVVSDGQVYVSETWTYETVEVAGAGSICSHEWLLDGDAPISRDLSAYLRDVAAAMGVRHGPMHAEIIIDESGPVAVDVAARMQGFMSTVAGQKALGHTHLTLTAQAVCDPEGFRGYVRGNTPYRRHHEALCVSLISETSGEVRGQPGMEAIRALPSFCDAIGFLGPGATLAPTRDLISTPGIVYLLSRDRGQIEADYARLRDMRMAEIFALA